MLFNWTLLSRAGEGRPARAEACVRVRSQHARGYERRGLLDTCERRCAIAVLASRTAHKQGAYTTSRHNYGTPFSSQFCGQMGHIGIVEKVQETSLKTDMHNRAVTVLHEHVTENRDTSTAGNNMIPLYIRPYTLSLLTS